MQFTLPKRCKPQFPFLVLLGVRRVLATLSCAALLHNLKLAHDRQVGKLTFLAPNLMHYESIGLRWLAVHCNASWWQLGKVNSAKPIERHVGHS